MATSSDSPDPKETPAESSGRTLQDIPSPSEKGEPSPPAASTAGRARKRTSKKTTARKKTTRKKTTQRKSDGVRVEAEQAALPPGPSPSSSSRSGVDVDQELVDKLRERLLDWSSTTNLMGCEFAGIDPLDWPDLFSLTDKEAADIAPPLARILARRAPAAVLVSVSDEGELLSKLLSVTGRNYIQLRLAIRELQNSPEYIEAQARVVQAATPDEGVTVAEPGQGEDVPPEDRQG